jgi:hypothetical protein
LKEAFEAHRAEAEALPDDRLPAAVTADLDIAYHNARLGTEAVLAEHQRIARELPRVSLQRLRALPSLVRAAMFAASQVDAPRAATRNEIDTRHAALQAVRMPLLLQIQVFKAKGLVDAAVVDRLAAGRGMLDHARDGITLEHLFTENRARWAGKHPFTDDEITAMGRHGHWLLEHVQPRGAIERNEHFNEYKRFLRAFWALAVDVHKQLRAVAMVLWGENELDARVPKLQIRHVPRKAKAHGKPARPANPT